MLENIIRAAVEKRCAVAQVKLRKLEREYRESEKLAVERFAKLIRPETIDQVNPELIKAIKQEHEALSYIGNLITQAQADLDTYKRLAYNSKAMQEFIDRHTGIEKRGDK